MRCSRTEGRIPSFTFIDGKHAGKVTGTRNMDFIKDTNDLAGADMANVKVIKNEDGKISLSMKALQEVPEEKDEFEDIEIPKSEELTTSLGSLFKNIKLD